MSSLAPRLSNMRLSRPSEGFLGLWRTGESYSGVIIVINLNEQSLSVILICRFHIDLQRAHVHPNASNSRSVSSISLGSFRVAIQSIHDAVMAEFGDPIPRRDQSEGESPKGDIIIADIAGANTDKEIKLTELRSQPHGSDDAAEV